MRALTRLRGSWPAALGGACLATLGLFLVGVLQVRPNKPPKEGNARYWDSLKYSFTRPEYVHPRIVQELCGWLSDSGEPITTIDLETANDSNRFFGEFQVTTIGDLTFVESRPPDGRGWFRYRLLATTPSGVQLVWCDECGGGSGCFRSLMLLRFQPDSAIWGWVKGTGIRPRVLLHTLGQIALGDRYEGRITYERGVLTVGPDESPWKFGGRVAPQEIRVD